MLPVLEAIFSLEFLLFSLGISAVVAILRRLIEFFILDNPKFKLTRTSVFWREVVLPSSPVIIGLIVTFFATDYPYPETLVSKSSQLMFGAVSGLTSGLVYRFLKSKFKKQIRQFNSDSDKSEKCDDNDN